MNKTKSSTRRVLIIMLVLWLISLLIALLLYEPENLKQNMQQEVNIINSYHLRK